MVVRRLAAPLLAVLIGLAAAGAVSARTPAVRRVAFAGTAASQWKPWWGVQQFDAGGVTLSSTSPTSPNETHSSLITTKRTWQDSTISFTTSTLQQLRQGSAPNPWEVGWLMFRFKDLHDYYWFMLKTNGFELGKKQGSDTQVFLDTGDLPALRVGERRQIRVRTQGPRIQVFVDGAKLVDYVDPQPLLSGSVGLYEEDSQARFDSLSVS